MDSPKKEVSSAATPREVDLFAEEALEEVFETIDSLRAQFDQLQIHCEKLAAEKSQVDQLLIDKETEYQRTKELLQEDVSNLRKVNLQLLASQKAFTQGETGIYQLKIYYFTLKMIAIIVLMCLLLIIFCSLEWKRYYM